MKKQLIWVLPLMLLSGFCGWYAAGIQWSKKSPELKSDVLAVVNDTVITEDDFITQMRIRGGQYAGQYHDMQQKQVLLEFLINQKLMMNKAIEQGIDEDPVVQKVYQQTVIDKFLEVGLNKQLANLKVPADEVKQYFEQHKSSYNRPARRRGAIIAKEKATDMTDADKQAIKDELLQVKEEAAIMPSHLTHFGELARNHSDDRASMYQGGVIGWLIESPNRAYKWPEAVTKSLFELSENGAMSDVIETENGYYLVRLVSSENVQETEFEQIASGIRQKLLNDKQNTAKKAFLDSVKANAQIQINQDLLQAIKPINSEPKDDNKQPPAMPVQAGVQP